MVILISSMAEQNYAQVYCVGNSVTRVQLQLQVACFDAYEGGWRLEEC